MPVPNFHPSAKLLSQRQAPMPTPLHTPIPALNLHPNAQRDCPILVCTSDSIGPTGSTPLALLHLPSTWANYLVLEFHHETHCHTSRMGCVVHSLLRQHLISDNLVELQMLLIPDKFSFWQVRMRQPNSACHFNRKENFLWNFDNLMVLICRYCYLLIVFCYSSCYALHIYI